MPTFSRHQQDSIDRRRSLAGIPIIHENITIDEQADNTIAMKIKRNRGAGFLDRFRPPVTEKRYELDEFGTFVVRQIDGCRTVMDVIRAFERRFNMSHREAELGVVAFLKLLMKRHILSIVVT